MWPVSPETDSQGLGNWVSWNGGVGTRPGVSTIVPGLLEASILWLSPSAFGQVTSL